MLGLSLRVSWICLLLFSSAACFPATKGDYRYPYTISSWDSSGSAPDTSRQPLVSLQHEAAPPQASSGGQSASSVGAPSVAAGSSQRYEPNKPSSAPTVLPQSGKLNMGSGVPAHRPAGHSTTFRMDGPVPYAGAPYAYGSPGLPWDEQPAGGADASFSDPSDWMPSRSFPDFSVWDSNGEMSQGGMLQGASETSPLPPSSYIVQSSNGYYRAREYLSHSKYSPEYLAFRAAQEPPESPPMTGSKGGQKV